MNNVTEIATNTTMINDQVLSIPIFQAVFTFVLAAIMFGMGCAVDHKKLKDNLRRPVGLAVGLISQIIFMPVITYVTIKVFDLTTIQSLALALIGLSPGGSNSNVITYLIKGDISLSVAMTMCTNILALATVPLWIFVYTAIEHVDDNLKIDYISLAITLLSIALPVTAGILFKYKFPMKAKIVPKVTAAIAIVMLIITIVAMIVIVRIPFVFAANTILPVGLLPFLGMAVSYVICLFPPFKLTNRARKAIAVETGIQNSGIANSVLILSFGDQMEIYGNAATIPLIYNISQTILLIVMVIGYKLWLCMTEDGRKETQEDQTVKTLTEQLDMQMQMDRNSRLDSKDNVVETIPIIKSPAEINQA